MVLNLHECPFFPKDDEEFHRMTQSIDEKNRPRFAQQPARRERIAKMSIVVVENERGLAIPGTVALITTDRPRHNVLDWFWVELRHPYDMSRA